MKESLRELMGNDLSLPVRGAWIEMLLCACVCLVIAVAPRAGSVD